MTEKRKVELVHEWPNKGNDFGFEVGNVNKHSLEEFTEENAKQNR